MAVRASRTISDGVDTFSIEHTFECGTFDLITENNPGDRTEIWRDCDLGTKNRRTLWPYSSGLKGVVDLDFTMPSRARHWKYFQATNDDFTATLSMTDINCGVLPPDFCTWLELYQNGKKLPCRAFTINFLTSIITILEEWRVPGASYEVVFWANPCGGSSTPGT